MPKPFTGASGPSRARHKYDGPPLFVRPPELARVTSTTEGFWRALRKRGEGPPVVTVGNVRLYELNAAVEFLRRNTVEPGPVPAQPRRIAS